MSESLKENVNKELDECYKLFIKAFANHGLDEWDRISKSIGGDSKISNSFLGKAAGPVGGSIGMFVFLAVELTSKVGEAASKIDSKNTLSILGSGTESPYDPDSTCQHLARIFVSVGIQTAKMFEKLVAEASRIGGDWGSLGVKKLAQDAFGRALANIENSPSNLALRDRLLYGIIHGKSERSKSAKLYFPRTRGRTIFGKMSLSTAFKVKLRLQRVEKLNTHKGFSRAGPVQKLDDGCSKWVAYTKIGKPQKKEMIHRRLAEFEEQNMEEYFIPFYITDNKDIGDPGFSKFGENVTELETELFDYLVENHESLRNLKDGRIIKEIREGFERVSGPPIPDVKRHFYVELPYPSFKGREKELIQLCDAFRRKDENKQYIVVISGLGGIGKTQLSINFASRIFKDFQDSSCFFLNVESNDGLTDTLIRICKQMDITFPPEHSRKEESKLWDIFAKVLNNAPSLQKTVVILDSMDSKNMSAIKLLIDFMKLGNAEIPLFIVTSREDGVLSGLGGYLASPIKLKGLDDAEADALANDILENLLRKKPSEKEKICELCQTVENYPLGLRQAAAYIQAEAEMIGGYTISEYLEDFETKKQELLDYNFDSVYELTTYTALAKTLDAVGEDARQILRIASFFGKNAFHIENVITIFQRITQGENKTDRKAAIKAASVLKKYNIIEEDNLIIKIHKLVHEVTRLLFQKELWEDAAKILSNSGFFDLVISSGLFDAILHARNEKLDYSSIWMAVNASKEIVQICKFREENNDEGVEDFIQKHWFSLLAAAVWEQDNCTRFYIFKKLVQPNISERLNCLLCAKALENSLSACANWKTVKPFCDRLWQDSYSDGVLTMTSIPEIICEVELDWSLQFLQILSRIGKTIFTERRRRGDVGEALIWWERYLVVEKQIVLQTGETWELTFNQYFQNVSLLCEVRKYDEAFNIPQPAKKTHVEYLKLKGVEACYSLYIARGLVETGLWKLKDCPFHELDFTNALLSSLEWAYQYIKSDILIHEAEPVFRAVRNCRCVVGLVNVWVTFNETVSAWKELDPDLLQVSMALDRQEITLEQLVSTVRYEPSLDEQLVKADPGSDLASDFEVKQVFDLDHYLNSERNNKSLIKKDRAPEPSSDTIANVMSTDVSADSEPSSSHQSLDTGSDLYNALMTKGREPESPLKPLEILVSAEVPVPSFSYENPSNPQAQGSLPPPPRPPKSSLVN